MKLIWHLKCRKCGDEISQGICSCGNVVFKPKTNQLLGIYVDDLKTCSLIKIWLDKNNKVFKRSVWFPLEMGKFQLVKDELV